MFKVLLVIGAVLAAVTLKTLDMTGFEALAFTALFVGCVAGFVVLERRGRRPLHR